MKAISNTFLGKFPEFVKIYDMCEKRPLQFSFRGRPHLYLADLVDDNELYNTYLVKRLTETTLDWLQTKHWNLNQFYTHSSSSLYMILDYGDVVQAYQVDTFEIPQFIPTENMYLTV